MKQDELTDLLTALPREKASTGFTTRVKAMAAESRPRTRWTFAVASSVAALLVIATIFTLEFSGHRHEQRQLTEMRAEKERIHNELRELKSMSDAAEAPVLIGSSGGYDLVLDPGGQKRVTSTNLPVVIVNDDGAL